MASMDIQTLVKKLLVPEEALAPVIVVAASAATLATAHGFQHIGGLEPCALCLDQRTAYWLAIGFGLVATFLYRRAETATSLWPVLVTVATTLALAWGTYLAGFHTGIEQGWWPGPASCTSTGMRTLEELLKDDSVVMCDDIPWSLFGISMAGYNALIAISLTIYSGLPLVRRFAAQP